MVYLDNAATSFPKPSCVLKNTYRFIKNECGNSGRSSHELAMTTSRYIYESREAVARLLGLSDVEKVVFTQNATYALNLAIKTTVSENSHVLISDVEHNAVLRPLFAVSKKKNISYSIFSTVGDIESNIENLITENTKCIISSLVSNVTGKEIKLEMLSQISKKHGLILILDASQALGHINVDLYKNYCDVLCSAGHKALFGIQGVGFAVFLDNRIRETIVEGGSGSDSFNLNMPSSLPERFEAGTLSAPAVVSLLHGIKFVEKTGLDEIRYKLSKIENRYVEIIGNLSDCTLSGHGNGIISFNVKNLSSEAVAYELNDRGICVRGGFHCSPLAHTALGTEKTGAVRISLSYMNSIKETDKFYKAIKLIAAK